MIQYLKVHIAWVIIVSVGIIGFRAFLQEHDQRLIVESAIKVSEAKVKQLQDQVAASDAAAAQTIAALKAQAKKVTTPQQAIAAIPDVSTLPLHATEAPTPGFVQVDALALYAQLNECAQLKAAQSACEVARSADEGIIAQKDTEIKALRKQTTFWHRVTTTLKDVGIGVGIGIVLAHKF